MTPVPPEGCLKVGDLRLAGPVLEPNPHAKRCPIRSGNSSRSPLGEKATAPPWGSSSTAAPPGLPLGEADIQPDMDRRRPGQSAIVTPRKEQDLVEILSGVFEGKTTGAPISLLVRNSDARPGAYDEMRGKFRPSHADFTYQAKYGLRDHRGGGRSSARETVGRVASGAVAKKLLSIAGDVQIRAYVTRVHNVEIAPDSRLSLAGRSRCDARPLPGSRNGRGHDRGHRGGPRRRGFRRRDHHLPDPRRAGRSR